MTRTRSALPLLTVLCLLLVAAHAQALTTIGRGNQPVPDRNWRAGAVDAANLTCRVAWLGGPPFGGGISTFLYRSDTETFNEALKVFAKVRAPSLELVVHDGPGESPFLADANDAKSNAQYDWGFVIWDARSFYILYGNPENTVFSDTADFRRPLPPPRINVFIGGGGAIDWDKVQVPKGIVVIDWRASAAGVKPGQGAVIAGNVFDMATSKPLPGARIAVEKAGARGAYEAVTSGHSDAAETV